MTQPTTTVKASFDTTTLEGQMRVFNAQNGASISMKDLPEGTTIEVSGLLQYDDTVDTYGQNQVSTITVLFATDGQSYASVSAPVANASEKLIQFFEKTGIESVKVRIVKGKSKSDRDFLNLQLVM